jgi:hypothetical protein
MSGNRELCLSIIFEDMKSLSRHIFRNLPVESVWQGIHDNPDIQYRIGGELSDIELEALPLRITFERYLNEEHDCMFPREDSGKQIYGTLIGLYRSHLIVDQHLVPSKLVPRILNGVRRNIIVYDEISYKRYIFANLPLYCWHEIRNALLKKQRVVNESNSGHSELGRHIFVFQFFAVSRDNLEREFGDPIFLQTHYGLGWVRKYLNTFKHFLTVESTRPVGYEIRAAGQYPSSSLLDNIDRIYDMGLNDM